MGVRVGAVRQSLERVWEDVGELRWLGGSAEGMEGGAASTMVGGTQVEGGTTAEAGGEGGAEAGGGGEVWQEWKSGGS